MAITAYAKYKTEENCRSNTSDINSFFCGNIAQVAQATFTFFSALRKLRKFVSILFVACASCASLPRFYLSFAQAAQSSFFPVCCLRKLRNAHPKNFVDFTYTDELFSSKILIIITFICKKCSARIFSIDMMTPSHRINRKDRNIKYPNRDSREVQILRIFAENLEFNGRSSQISRTNSLIWG